MQTVADIIASYSLAGQQLDGPGAMRALARLESDEFCNEGDWEQILAFCRLHHFDARLEIITRRLIKSGSLASYKPYFVLVELLLKSGFKAEARAVAEEYKNLAGRLPAPGWDFVSLLFSVDDFAGCLHEARAALKESPDAFAFLIMEASCLWSLSEVKAARARLKTLSALADRDPGQLVWLAYVAMEWGERELLRTSVAKLVQLIAAGAARLTAGAVHVLQQCGYLPEIQHLVRTAQPVHYESLEELAYVFELARERGAYATGLAFGEAILRVAPDHRLKREIEKLAAAKGFLMS